MALVNTKRFAKSMLIQINNPGQLNALSNAGIEQLNTTFKQADKDDDINSVIITGHKEFFASGGNILDVLGRNLATAYNTNILIEWEEIAKFSKPIIA